MKIFLVRVTIIKFLKILGPVGLVIFGCYAFEQVFFELFVGTMNSSHRPFELGLITVLFITVNCYLPYYKMRKSGKGWRSLLFWVGYPICFVLLISFTNLGFYLGRPLEIPTNYKKCDAIVVIDMGSYPARGQIGAELYHRGLADKFVVFVPRRPPYVDFTIGTLGILPQSLIWARGNENNTRIGAKKIKSLITENSWNDVIVVADYFHILRVILTLKKLGLNNNIYPVNVPRSFYQSKPTRLLGWQMKELWDVHYSDLSFVSKFRFRHQLTIKTMHEYSGIIFYALMGYL